MIASLGSGESRISNYSTAADCLSTLQCLAALGVDVRRDGGRVIVRGNGLSGLRQSTKPLDAGNSGSTIRMLSGILAGQPLTTRISGDESIQGRPMNRIIGPLRLMGAKIEAREDNYAPLLISGGHLHAIEYSLPVASAQVKSCVLLAGLFAAGTTTVIEPTPTRNHTEIMLRECGARLDAKSGGHQIISVTGQSELNPLGDYDVAGDLSSAAFFIAAALVTAQARISLRSIGYNKSRTGFIDTLREMGATIAVSGERIRHGEPVADLLIESSKLQGDFDLRGDMIANLIDEIPVLAVVATQLNGTLNIRGARELRVKESDRIRSVVDNLRALGAEVEEFDDGFRITGPQKLRGGRIDSYGDHRIAMAFAVAGLLAEGETLISGAEAASVSLPEFYSLLRECGAEVSTSAH
jgi:3-phosphoshikimate 1-carboxyvinyltransferase